MKSLLSFCVALVFCGQLSAAMPPFPAPVSFPLGTESGSDSLVQLPPPETNDFCQTLEFALGVPSSLQFGDASQCCYECWFGNSPGSRQYHKIFTGVFPNFYDGTNWYLLQQAYDRAYWACPITIDTRKYWWFTFRAFTNYVRPMASDKLCTNRIFQNDIYSCFEGSYFTSNLQVTCWQHKGDFVIAGWGLSNATYQIADTGGAFQTEFDGTNGIWQTSMPLAGAPSSDFFKITSIANQ